MDENSALSAMLAAKKKQFENMAHEYRDGCARLREARRALRTLVIEWDRICQSVDDICDLMGTDRGWPLARFQVKDPDGGGGNNCNRKLPDPASLSAYFGLVDRRLNDVLFRLFFVQSNRGGGVGRGAGGCDDDDDSSRLQRQRLLQRPAQAGESMSTGSEQEDDFVARDLNGDKNRQAKMMAAVDPSAVPVDDKRLDLGLVSSICPE